MMDSGELVKKTKMLSNLMLISILILILFAHLQVVININIKEKTVDMTLTTQFQASVWTEISKIVSKIFQLLKKL